MSFIERNIYILGCELNRSPNIFDALRLSLCDESLLSTIDMEFMDVLLKQQGPEKDMPRALLQTVWRAIRISDSKQNMVEMILHICQHLEKTTTCVQFIDELTFVNNVTIARERLDSVQLDNRTG